MNSISFQEIITFIIYILVLLSIGLYFYNKTSRIEDYLLGGKKMGKWVTALSAQASDMSGWLMMGLPGALYLGGFKEAWIAIGLLLGTAINWILVAPRLRVYTEVTGSLTLSTFFERRFRDPSKALRLVSALVILFFFTIYVSSGSVATGKLFESMFGMNYQLATFLGAFIILVYTFLGGYLAVCWTDFFQGCLMFFAMVVTPIAAYFYIGDWSLVSNTMAQKGMTLSLIPDDVDFKSLFIMSLMAWGLGYFGQPHILSRFMSIHSEKDLRASASIALIWVMISMAGAVFAGLLGIAMFDNLQGAESEKVFIYQIKTLFDPWLRGVMVAAILSAIMSTISSQLLVASSSLTEDFYEVLLDKKASNHEKVIVGRVSVIVISLVALLLAMNPHNKILDLVAYAWGGLGAAFGPVLLFALFAKKTTWYSALAGMLMGTITLITWKMMGWNSFLYELFPGFFANVFTLFFCNFFFPQLNSAIEQEFNQVKDRLVS